MTNILPDGVLLALEQAKRTAGWNMRRGDVRRFTLANEYGREACHLYVVPARCWAYRRWERRRAEHSRGFAA
jgi:hypothetical protein